MSYLSGFVHFIGILLIFGTILCETEQPSINTSDVNQIKVFVDHFGNVVPHPGPPGVRPTSLPVYHKPGQPPKEEINEIVNQKPNEMLNRPTEGSTESIKPVNKPFDPLSWLSSIFGHSDANSKNGTKLPGYVFEANFHKTTVVPDYAYSQYNGTILVKPAPLVVLAKPAGTSITSHSTIFDQNINENNLEIHEHIGGTSNPDIITFSTFSSSANYEGTPQSSALFFKPNSTTNLETGQRPQNSTEPNKGVIDWILSAFGINNNNNQPQQEVVPAKNCQPCSCGQSFKHTRIVGGIETQVNAYPWMTILTYNGRFYCGATVINSKYIITATHCVNGFAKERLEATFLDHDRSTPFETATFTRRISAILKHRGYNQGYSYNNDISLLKLNENLPMNGLLTPVCLPVIGKSYTGHSGIVTGWGATESHGSVSNRLREVEVPIMSNIACRNTGYGPKITDNMLCAGYAQGTKDSCQGDSGGPLHVINSSSHTIVGIVSWGEGCAEPNYPGVYTRVNRYISWIKSNTRDACYCEIVK